jgi:DNA-directed RNA polymerase subunit M/transcription elongation factor TFIIS
VAIALSCACGAKLSVPDSMAGKKGKCPTCGALLAVPANASASAFAVASRDLTGSRDLAVSGDEADQPAKAAPDKTPTMRFRCPKCGKTLKVPLRFAGQTGKCGGCGSSFQAPVPPQVAGSVKPPSLRAAFAIEKVRCECGVTTSRRGGGDIECPACGRLLQSDSDG